MKKIMKLFVYVAAAAMTLASCQKTEVDNNLPKGYEYTFLLGSADTKAVVGDNCVEWEAGDRVGSFTKVNNGYSEVSVNDGQATISVYSPEGLAVNDKLYFYYPKASGSTVQKTSVPMSIPTEQDGKDEMPMASLPFTVIDASADNNTDYAGEIKFANLGAVIEFYVYSTNTDYLSEKVQSVTYDAGAALAGNFEFDLTSVNYADQNTLKISGYEATSVVSSLAEPVVVGTSKEKAAKVKMVVAPGSYAGTITVKTDKATYTYNIATPKEYTRSSLRPLGADLAKGTRTAATTEEYTIQWDSASDWTDDMTLYSGYYTVKAVKNNGSTPPTINPTKYDCRVYAKGSVTVTHYAANIKKLVFNISDQGKKRLTDITASVGTVTIDTEDWKVIWEGDASSVTFTVGDKAKYGTDGEDEAGQLCFTSINAVAETTDAPIVAVLKKITLSGMTTEYELKDEFSFDGTVTASYFNGEDETVEPTEVIEPDMTTAGTKEVTVKYTEEGVTCEAKYSINVTDPNAGGNEGGETTEAWTLVTDASTLAVGDKIVIVASDSNYAMGADKGNNRNAASITKSGNTVVINDDVQIITLEAGKVSNTFAFNTGEGYLYAASSGSNYLKTKTTLDDNGSWAITITPNGVATIKAQGTYTRNWIRKNSSSALFACYASGQSDVSIYKLVGGSSEGGGETPEPEPVDKQTIAEVIALNTDAAVNTEGLVVAKYERGILISDASGIIIVYKGEAVDAQIGDQVAVSGKKGVHNGWAQIATPTVEVTSSGNNVTYPSVAELNGSGMDDLLSATSVSYIQYTGTLTISGTYYNVGVEGATTAIGSIQYPVASLGLSDMNGKKIKVTGYHVGISSGKYVNTMATSVEVVETEEEPETPAPVINISTASPIEVAANGGNGNILYAIENPTTATIKATADAEWLTLGEPTSTSVSYTVIENTGAERIATIKLAYEGAESKTVTVKQAAAEPEPDQPGQGGVEPEKGAPYSYEISNSSSKSNSWNKLMGGTNNSSINISAFSNKSITMGDLNWTVSASGASQIYFSGQQIGSSSNYISSFVLESDSYNGAVESITLTTCSNAGTTTIEVYVGGEQLGSTVTLPNSGTASDVTFSGDSLLEGKIYIKYTIPTAKKNIKITKISIN